MSDANFGIITGRLGRPPELRKTPSGVFVADFSVANNLYGANKKERTTWIRCVVWNKPAEWAAENLDKGDHVEVHGQMVCDDYTPSTTGIKTKGRIKLDNCRVTLVSKARKKTDEELSTADAPEPDVVVTDTPVTPEITVTDKVMGQDGDDIPMSDLD